MCTFFDMAPPLTRIERDLLRNWPGSLKLEPIAIHARLEKRRRRRVIQAPNLKNVKKALRGLTNKQGLEETRGRRATYTRSDVLKISRCREKLANDKTLHKEGVWQNLIENAGVLMATQQRLLGHSNARALTFAIA